ncbi:butenolide phosphate reductase ScbC [Nocardia callitridis]|uniref:Butenolide phosphate reductase ScbC n=1 Tax=Nocardia callitridis TaxID=648753 RepID=A0ABP9JY17_9NOCA
MRAVSRNPERARLPEGVEVVRGDYDDRDSIVAALSGVHAAFLVGQLGPEYVEGDPVLINTARAAGVDRIVKLSAIGTGDPEVGPVSEWHIPGEQATRDNGGTILRPSSFASNTLAWAEAIRAGRPVPNTTGSGKQGVIDPHDIAAVAVEALLTADHAGRTYTLTGPELLGTPELADILASALGHAVEVAEVPEAVMRARMLASGMSPKFAEGALGGNAHIRNGGNAVLTEDVPTVLGRRARTYAEWVTDHLSTFRTS